MKKTMFIIRAIPAETRTAFRERLHLLARRLRVDLSPAGMKLSLTAEPPPRWNVIPFRKELIACISIRDPERGSVASLQREPGYSGAYVVSEALPVYGEKNWTKDRAAEGAGLLTLFRAKKGLSESEFLRRWFDGHTPLTLRLHPLNNYNRNHVVETLSGSVVQYDGIVEEHTAERKDLLNPFRFFGKPPATLWNMLTVLRDVRGFIDYGSIETYLIEEIVLK